MLTCCAIDFREKGSISYRDFVFFAAYFPHHQLFDGLLQPQADERSQGVVEEQEHDGIHKVVPLSVRVNYEHPGVGAVALNNGGDAKHTAVTEKHTRGEMMMSPTVLHWNNGFRNEEVILTNVVDFILCLISIFYSYICHLYPN